MSESFVQLPPNSTGIEIRVIQGDSSNLIPTGVTEEVVVPTDAQGLMAGDARQAATAINMVNAELETINATLSRIAWILRVGLDVEIDGDDFDHLGA